MCASQGCLAQGAPCSTTRDPQPSAFPPLSLLNADLPPPTLHPLCIGDLFLSSSAPVQKTSALFFFSHIPLTMQRFFLRSSPTAIAALIFSQHPQYTRGDNVCPRGKRFASKRRRKRKEKESAHSPFLLYTVGNCREDNGHGRRVTATADPLRYNMRPHCDRSGRRCDGRHIGEGEGGKEGVILSIF